MQSVKTIDVFADNKLVGTLTGYGRGKVAFEYADSWLSDGFSVSPFSLPLNKKLYVPENTDFEGLFGVFDDSLPDGWGRLLTDRYLTSKEINPSGLNRITRLAMLPDTAAGFLEYRPRLYEGADYMTNDYDALFSSAKAILGEVAVSSDDIMKLYNQGGSSGGARPKVNAVIDGELWIVKFPASVDGEDAGVREYECNKMAVDAGLDVAPFKLLKSKYTKGFFATKRFDRIKNRRVHMVSLSGLLESSHRFPALDYQHLLRVTMLLTKSKDDLYEAFRRACFNVFVDNQDDHGKNFAFLYDKNKMGWHLSPAYDLTKSQTYYGEHSTTVCGKGRDITADDLRKLADDFKLRERDRDEIIRDVKNVCKSADKIRI